MFTLHNFNLHIICFFYILIAKFYLWELVVEMIYPYNNYVSLSSQNTSVSVGIIADNMKTFHALLELSPDKTSSTPPTSVQIKMGLFNISTFQNGSINYSKTNNSITSALLKIFNQDVYLMAQSYFPDKDIFSYIRDQFYQLGMHLSKLPLHKVS